MKKIAFITPPDAEHGFGLAGIVHHVVDAEEIENILKKVTADPDAGLLIMDERIIRELPEERMKELEEAWHGIILALPSPEKPPEEAGDYAARLIRRAIGYHVRIRL